MSCICGTEDKGRNIELHCPAHLDEVELGQNGDNFSLNGLTEYDGAMVRNIHIQFATDAKLTLKVNARFNREAGARYEASAVTCFQVIDVGPVAMHVFSDGMAGAVYELVSIARLADDMSAHLIHFPPAWKVAIGRTFLYE
jgi:hypothetical protein